MFVRRPLPRFVSRGEGPSWSDGFHIVVTGRIASKSTARADQGLGPFRLAELMGIPQAQEVWAAGDAANDLEMVSWAGVGCAMGHAPDALKEQANLILPESEEHGLQHWCYTCARRDEKLLKRPWTTS